MVPPTAVIETPCTPTAPPGAILARLMRVDDWSSLVGGDAFVVNNARVIRFGTIEITSGDDSIAWVSQSGAEPRQLISRTDGHELWIAPRQLQISNGGRS